MIILITTYRFHIYHNSNSLIIWIDNLQKTTNKQTWENVPVEIFKIQNETTRKCFFLMQLASAFMHNILHWHQCCEPGTFIQDFKLSALLKMQMGTTVLKAIWKYFSKALSSFITFDTIIPFWKKLS